MSLIFVSSLHNFGESDNDLFSEKTWTNYLEWFLLESFKKETSPLGTHLQNNYGHDVQIDVYHLSTHVIYM